MKINTCFKLMLFLVSSLFVSSSFAYEANLSIDCYDSSMKNENSSNLITVTFWSKDFQHRTGNFKNSMIGDCDSISDLVFKTNASIMDYIIVETSGNDGFWMDELQLITKWNTPDGQRIEKVQSWGEDGGKGYCLSTDPKDGEGAWKSRVDGCHKAIKFEVKSGKAFPTTPKTRNINKVEYSINVDCYDPSMENESTSNIIIATFFAGSRKLKREHFYNGNSGRLNTGSMNETSPGCGSLHDTKSRIYSDQNTPITHVVLQTNGNDGFWMDEVYLDLDNGINDKTIKRWGRDGGKGYCLSTDPKDGKGAWKGRVDGCHKAIKFDVKSGDAFPTNPVS